MKRNLLLAGIALLILTGCNANKQPAEKQEVVTQEETVQEEVVETEQQPQEEVEEVKAQQPDLSNIPFTFYRIVPAQIEVFSYKGLYDDTIVDDTKLSDSFYLKGNYIRIEKIYSSKIGERYGKIAGKGLLVSMDDLEIKQN